MNEWKISNANDLGARIRSRRVELRLTQVELADVARVTPRLVGELERGKSTAHLEGVMRILASLGLDLYLRTR
jgi:y4mF family transcriptional regulator